MKTSAHEKFLEMLGWEGDELKSFLFVFPIMKAELICCL